MDISWGRKTENEWDLTSLFSSQEEWENAFQELERLISGYVDFEGCVCKSSNIFELCLSFHHGVMQRMERVYIYAHLKRDEDRTNEIYDGLFQRAISLNSKVRSTSDFICHEIQGVSPGVIASYLKDDGVAKYEKYVTDILRRKDHTPKHGASKILALADNLLVGSRQVFHLLDDVDFEFGQVINAGGETVKLTHGRFSQIMGDSDRSVRKAAYHKYYNVYKRHQHGLSGLLTNSINKDLFCARAHGFNDARKASLFRHDVEDSLYDGLTSHVRQFKPSVLAYQEFRKQLLDLNELHYYDLNVPIVPWDFTDLSYEDAVKICVDAFSLLGEEYCAVVKQGLLEKRWVHRYEAPGKRKGGYSLGAYGSHPFILLNYNSKSINSLFTLAHEAGHAMHSYWSCKQQPFQTHQYSYLAGEIVATVNKMLLGRHLIGLYKDKDPLLHAYFLNRQLDNIQGTLYRQSMLAEFESVVHLKASRNEPLTLPVILNEYRTLLEAYWGGIVVIDDVCVLECLRLSHFYNSFYVYQYAMGLCVATQLLNQMETRGDESIAKYLNFLGAGGRQFPIDALADAGVDVSFPGLMQVPHAYFEQLRSQLSAYNWVPDPQQEVLA